MRKNKLNLSLLAIILISIVSISPIFAEENDAKKIELETQSVSENDKNFSSESHKNTTSNLIKNLKKVSDKEGEAGNKIKIIANEQDKSNEISSNAINDVEGRGNFKAFFLGSDYQNIGLIRSEMAKTNNQITKLKELMNETTNSDDKVTLDTQIKLLEEEQTKIRMFLNLHEDNFSLFGWLVKILN